MSIVYGMPAEQYHASEGTSKSQLWKLHEKTPGHMKFGEMKETDAMLQGTAIHTAILEPHLYDAKYMRGPEDRRGNKWKDAEAQAVSLGKVCLTDSDYADALLAAKAIRRNPDVMKLLDGDIRVEASAFWVDAETGVKMRCRPDAMNQTTEIMLDLKSTADASDHEFQKKIAKFGYHVQEAIYTDGWLQAGGGNIKGFAFIVIEPDAPFFSRVIELAPGAVLEGYEVYRRALLRYKRCAEANNWAGYDSGVSEMDLPRWAYRYTKPEIAQAAE
jgi:hypothetical protein